MVYKEENPADKDWYTVFGFSLHMNSLVIQLAQVGEIFLFSSIFMKFALLYE